MADTPADQLRAELRTVLDSNTDRLVNGLRVELSRDIVLEQGRRMQFEVDPFFYGIHSCVSEEPVFDGDRLADELPTDWFKRTEEVLGGWDNLVWEEMCLWFAECWQKAGGPQRYSPAFLFFHGYHCDQYDLERRRWLSGTELDEVWDEQDSQAD